MTDFPGRLRAPRYATAPPSAIGGEIYYDTALDEVRALNATGGWNAQLPKRLRAYPSGTSDYNTAVETGWYAMAPGALNAPGSSYYELHVLALDGNNTRQFAYDYISESSFQRRRTSNVWQPWLSNDRLNFDCAYVANLNTIAGSGWYAFASDATGAPGLVYGTLFQMQLGAGNVRQWAYQYNVTGQTWTRERHDAGAFGAWVVVDSGWTNLALLDSWVNYEPGAATWAVARSRNQAGIVTVGGLIKRGAAPAQGSPIATLPAGSRPGTNTRMFCCIAQGAVSCRIDVNPNGSISFVEGPAANAAGFLSLDGITFQAGG